MSPFERGVFINQEFYTSNGAVLIPPTVMRGSGDMVAPDLDAESLQELARAVDAAQQPIDEADTADCFDPRGLLALGDGTQPNDAMNRARMAGADTLTGFMMVELLPERWRYYPQNVASLSVGQRFDAYMSVMKQLRNPGAHGPKCGAAVGFPVLVENNFKLYTDISAGMADTMRNFYDRRVHEAIRDIALSKVDNGAFIGWDHHSVVDHIPPSAKHFQHLDNSGDNNGYAPLAVVANNRPGATLHKPSLVGSDGAVLQVFQYDTYAIQDVANKLATTEEEFTYMIHSGVAMQENAAATLGANMRKIILN